MKFAIVLLAVVAVATAAPQERGILDTIESTVQGAISKATSDLDSIMTLVQGLTSSAQSKIESVIANSKNNIASTIAGIESTISTMISKGGAVALCAQQNLGELNEFKNSFGKNVESCSTSVSSAIVAFEQEVFGQVASLKSSVFELVTIVEECSASALEAAYCAITKVKQVQTLIDSIISQASAAVEVARSKATVSVGQVQTCAQQVVGEATITLNKFASTLTQVC